MHRRIVVLARAALLALLSLSFVAAVGLSFAQADKVHSKYKGKIILSRTSFPDGFKSDADMIKYLKKVNEDEFIRNKQGAWNFEYMGFLKEKLEQRNAVIVFYDISDRGYEPTEVTSRELRPDDPHSLIVAGYETLEGDLFQAEKRYEMQITRGRNQKPLARAEFVLRD